MKYVDVLSVKLRKFHWYVPIDKRMEERLELEDLLGFLFDLKDVLSPNRLVRLEIDKW
jgi:hypothetical protein